MISQLFHRRRAERLAQLLDQADGGRVRHSRSSLDDKLATELAIGHRLQTIELSHEARPAPAFQSGLRATLVATAEREAATGRQAVNPAPAQRRPVAGRIYADVSPGSATSRARTGNPTRRGIRRTRLAIVLGVAGGALALSGMSMASGDAMPGDPLYGMKRSAESAQLVLAGSDVDRGQAYLNFARTRAREAEVIRANRGRLAPVLGDLDKQTTAGMRLLTSAALSHHDAAILDAVDSFVAAQRPVLTELLDTVSQRDRPLASRSLDLLAQIGARADALRRTIACPSDGRSDPLGPLPPACSGH